MTDTRPSSGTAPAQPDGVVISLDAMGGDKGPQVVVAGLEAFLAETPGAQVLLHGPEAVLTPLTRKLGDRVRASPHFREGVSAFLEKRKPNYE